LIPDVVTEAPTANTKPVLTLSWLNATQLFDGMLSGYIVWVALKKSYRLLKDAWQLSVLLAKLNQRVVKARGRPNYESPHAYEGVMRSNIAPGIACFASTRVPDEDRPAMLARRRLSELSTTASFQSSKQILGGPTLPGDILFMAARYESFYLRILQLQVIFHLVRIHDSDDRNAILLQN
jgi:hypothetical protein